MFLFEVQFTMMAKLCSKKSLRNPVEIENGMM